MANYSTYSFLDLTGSFTHPLAGVYTFFGQKNGLVQVTITNATDRTEHNVAADGYTMTSYIAGDNGSATIECQQNSPLHAFLLNWFNLCKTAADAGDPSNWASATLTMRNILDGSFHTLTGVSPQKVPDKQYGKSGTTVQWSLMAAQVISE